MAVDAHAHNAHFGERWPVRAQANEGKAHTTPGDNARGAKGCMCARVCHKIWHNLNVFFLFGPNGKKNKQPTVREKTVDGLSGWNLTHQSGKTDFRRTWLTKWHMHSHNSHMHIKANGEQRSRLEARKKRLECMKSQNLISLSHIVLKTKNYKLSMGRPVCWLCQKPFMREIRDFVRSPEARALGTAIV